METSYKKTRFACYRGFITQAIIVNLAPLFFVIFREKFGLNFIQIANLTGINFGAQIIVDFLGVLFVDRLGYRRCLLWAHACAFLGLVGLGLLPFLMPPYAGLITATITYAIGSGLVEVLLSPVVDNLPAEPGGGAMALLHSFYSWGQMAVVLLTTIVIRIIGEDLWFLLSVLWSLLPLYNYFSFRKVPIIEPEQKTSLAEMKRLFGNGVFYLAILLMICSGASEQVMSQWASMFAEKGIGVSKIWGDILGPCFFAFTMGIGRTVFGVLGDRINMRKAIMLTSLGAVACYLVTVFVSIPILALLGCAMTGFMVSAMWPGMLDLSSARMKGGTAMFGLLAVAGDMGCSGGPMLAGVVSDFAEKSGLAQSFSLTGEQFGMKAGILAAIIFPVIMFFGTLLFKEKKKA
ncbi:MAG: MFS transporter [Clostridia bacterium]|nr:MFS transporter [Clostridia bacterium]